MIAKTYDSLLQFAKRKATEHPELKGEIEEILFLAKHEIQHEEGSEEHECMLAYIDIENTIVMSDA